MSGITLEGKLSIMEQESVQASDVVRFPEYALREISKLSVIWGATNPPQQAHKDFWEGTAGRLQLEQLPGYAPQLNPYKEIWKNLKHVIFGCIGQLRFDVK